MNRYWFDINNGDVSTMSLETRVLGTEAGVLTPEERRNVLDDLPGLDAIDLDIVQQQS